MIVHTHDCVCVTVCACVTYVCLCVPNCVRRSSGTGGGDVTGATPGSNNGVDVSASLAAGLVAEVFANNNAFAALNIDGTVTAWGSTA